MGPGARRVARISRVAPSDEREHAGVGTLVAVELDVEKPARIEVDADVRDGDHQWVEDTPWLVYLTRDGDRSLRGTLRAINIVTGERRTLGERVASFEYRVAPEGRAVVYIGSADERGAGVLTVRSVPGGDPKEIARGVAWAEPAGDRILFAVVDGPEAGLYSVPLP
jgi:hypothetical protein